MNKTFVNLETKKEHLYIELRNDITSLSISIKKKKAEKDFPLVMILFMNIRLKIKSAIIYLSRITPKQTQKISL